jgi:hypothetical protein
VDQSVQLQLSRELIMIPALRS